jgi:regulator of cell morphogenesis and NO signaling
MDRVDVATRPLDMLCVGIVERYHAALHRDLPAIRDQLLSLCRARGAAVFESVHLAFSDLADLIEGHLAKEEHLLFPALEALATAYREGRRRPPMPFVSLVHPIRVMEAEHLRIETAMEHLRSLVLEVTEPESLIPTWRRCLTALAQLDRDLADHHTYETTQLFPRALELENRMLV